VSNDGGATWTSFVINEDVPANGSTRTNDRIALDISDLAGNQADVLVKFVWDGDYYFWLIDDINLYDSRGVDFAIIDFTNIDNYETPDFGLLTDSFDLEMMVVNNSDIDVTDSIMFLARVLTIDAGDLVFSDTGWVEGMNMGDTLIWDFDRDWVPTEVTQEGHFIAYNVRFRGDTMLEIITPDDNVDFNAFDARDFSYRKVPASSRTQGYNFGGMEYDVANFVSLPEDALESYVIDKISFRVCEGTDPLVGKTVIGFVVQLPDSAEVLKGTLLNGETDLIGLDAATGLNALIENGGVIGIGSYLFTATDDASQCEEFFIDELTNLDGDPESIFMEPGGKYLVGVRFGATASDLFIGTNEDYKLWQISTIISTPQDGSPNWGLVVDYQENAADVGLELAMSTAVDENPLPENSVQIYPNPASDVVRVDVNFESATDLSITIADALGKIIAVIPAKNVVSDQFTQNMTRYPSGNYIVRVATKQGTKTEHIVVTH
jgi:hypothetical protein